MVERTQDLVVIQRNGDDLNEVFKEVIALAAEANKAANETPETLLTEAQQEELADLLRKLAQSEVNVPEGTPSALIAGTHFPLKKSLFSALIITVSLTGGVVAFVINPIAGSVSIAGTVLMAAERVTNLLTPLNAEELTVYEALVRLMHQKKREGAANLASTAAEVEALIEGETPDIEPLLVVLCDKKVIQRGPAAHGFEYWVEA